MIPIADINVKSSIVVGPQTPFEDGAVVGGDVVCGFVVGVVIMVAVVVVGGIVIVVGGGVVVASRVGCVVGVGLNILPFIP